MICKSQIVHVGTHVCLYSSGLMITANIELMTCYISYEKVSLLELEFISGGCVGVLDDHETAPSGCVQPRSPTGATRRAHPLLLNSLFAKYLRVTNVI